jgi:phosphonoacetaldehyde hydrolase
MVYLNLDLMDVSPIQSVVKVDDTISGVGEALEAGCWSVAVARYSNYMNVDSLDEVSTFSDEEVERRVDQTRRILEQAGAHYVVDGLAELPEVIEDINARLASGEKP